MIRSAIAALIVPLALLATPAYAGTPGCVGDGEFRSVDNGWTKARVHDVFETEGTQFSRDGEIVTRQYRACPSAEVNSRFVLYRYRDGAWRVVDKI